MHKITEFRIRRRNKLIALLGGKCVKCDSVTDLEFDHKDRLQMSFRINGNNLNWNWERVWSEAQKCQLLCKNHHIEKTAREVLPGHGTVSRYVHRKLPCRCEECRKAQAISHKKWRDKRRKQGKNPW